MRLCAAALACVIAQPAVAQMRQGDAAVISEAEAAAAVEASHSGVAAYGAWLLRLNKAIDPAISGLRGMQGKWQEMSRTSSPAVAGKLLRPALAGVKARIATSIADLKALDRPDVSALELDADIQPDALVAQTLTLLTQFDSLVDTMDGVAAAMIAGNAKAAEAGTKEIFVAARLIYDTQTTLTNAFLATAAPDRAEYDTLLIERTFFAIGSRVILAAERIAKAQTDGSLPADLERFAAELDRIAARGRGRVVTELADLEEQQARDHVSDDAGKILAKAIAVTASQREAFAIAERFAADIRLKAAGLRKARTPQAVFGMAGLLAPVRQQFDQVAIQQAAIMAQ
ncbi:hypothetical protein FHS96_002245 [Sphingomonas zeicaulis]|uniref:hypothetical protein n=1 Tax=Sphingomonas zeicaulis TaxID=1632740 RepID=UPI003D217BB4